MGAPRAARFRARYGACLTAVCALLSQAVPGAQKAPAPPPAKFREVPLDLPADFPPLFCGGALYLFSGAGRNQTLAPGADSPACNLIELDPLSTLCGPDGPVVLTRGGYLWNLGTGEPKALEQGLDGAIAIAPGPGILPVVLFSDRLRLSDGSTGPLPFQARAVSPLEGGGFFVAGQGAGARLDPSGNILWTWMNGLSPTGVCMGDGFLATGTEEGFLVALDAASGKERFRYPTGGAIVTAPIFFGGTAVFASRDHLVRSVRLKDGQLAWQVRLEGRPDFGPIRTRAGLVFAVSAGSTITAIDPADGRRTFTWRLPIGQILQSPSATDEKVAVLAWGEAESPTLYLVDVPQPAPPPPKPQKKVRRDPSRR